jgi:hypothetical protein
MNDEMHNTLRDRWDSDYPGWNERPLHLEPRMCAYERVMSRTPHAPNPTPADESWRAT